MNKSQRDILNQLKEKPMTLNELSGVTKYSKSGIAGRISELKKMGYDIQSKSITVNKYYLVKDTSLTKKISDLIEERGLYGIPVKVTRLADVLEVSENEIKKGLVSLIEKGKATQMSNLVIQFKKI
jgi:biotin operon repressor